MNQAINLLVHIKKTNQLIDVPIIYGANVGRERCRLWDLLSVFGNNRRSIPRAILGDFNVTKDPTESQGGSKEFSSNMADFKSFLEGNELDDLRFDGFHFTWHNKRPASLNFAKKLDRVLVNEAWHSIFPLSTASFLEQGVSDHSPIFPKLNLGKKRRKKIPSKFFNLCASLEDFLLLVSSAWSKEVTGKPMFRVVQKLKRLKLELKSFNKHTVGNIPIKVEELRSNLASSQRLLKLNPSDHSLRAQKANLLSQFLEASTLKRVSSSKKLESIG